jgi:hypothetical protein
MLEDRWVRYDFTCLLRSLIACAGSSILQRLHSSRPVLKKTHQNGICVGGVVFWPAASVSEPAFPCDRFTPDCEEKLCGHATLATTHVLSGLPQCSSVSVFTYQTRSGPLRATRDKDGAIELDFPADDIAPVVDATERAELEKKALASIRAQGRVLGVYRGRLDTIIELEMKDGVALADVEVDVKELVGTSYCSRLGYAEMPLQLGTTKRGTVLTAQTASDVAGDAPVFHSRFMCPGWTHVTTKFFGASSI